MFASPGTSTRKVCSASGINAVRLKMFMLAFLTLVVSIAAADEPPLQDPDLDRVHELDQAHEPNLGLLTLVGGDQCRGVLIEAELAQSLRWQVDVLSEPIDFRIGRIESIRFDRSEIDALPEETYRIELASGDELFGSIHQWTPDSLTIASDEFGSLELHLDGVRRLQQVGKSIEASAAEATSAPEPTTAAADNAAKNVADLLRLQLASGESRRGKFKRFEADSQRLTLEVDGVELSISLAEVVDLKFAPSQSVAESLQAALFLRSGTRVSGNLVAVDVAYWILQADHFAEPIRVRRASVRSLRIFRTEAAESVDAIEAGRSGKLIVDDRQLTGRLIASGERSEAEESPLLWRADAALNAAAIRLDRPSRIVYRERATRDPGSVEARAAAMQQRRLQQQRRGLNFGELFLQRVDQARDAEPTRDAHLIHARTGDVVACRVESIDDSGVTISTVHTDRGHIHHDRIKAIEFTAHSPPPDLQEAKRQRLLTIPRLQENHPPTHLLCSHNGDFLRCRLLNLRNGLLSVEVQSQTMQVPRERVAQIIWFHSPADDAIETAAEGSEENAAEKSSVTLDEPQDADSFRRRLIGRVQVLQRDDKRITFEPTMVTLSDLQGQSDLIGPVRLGWNAIDELIIGPQIALAVSDMAYQQWTLQP